jgi:Methyltransferase domain
MLGIPLRYLLKHPVAGLKELARDPAEVWTTVHETYIAQRERKELCPYKVSLDWEARLHHNLGAPWPCQLHAEFWPLWTSVVEQVRAKGIDAGPMSFLSWNDGDAGFVRALWCLLRHRKPQKVVETGVAHGFTSRFILEALERNGDGQLFSIDLPPLERQWRSQVGVAVGDRLKNRWTYVQGSSRRKLSSLLSNLGEIDLFVHDSLHSERNVLFELETAWPRLRRGGSVVVDDVDANWGFARFTESQRTDAFFTCEAEPLRPDLRRVNHKGLFGIVLKTPDTAQLAKAARAGGGQTGRYAAVCETSGEIPLTS